MSEDLIGALLVILFVAGGLVKKLLEDRKAKEPPQRRVRPEDLPEETRRMLYGSPTTAQPRRPTDLGIPTAQPRQAAPTESEWQPPQFQRSQQTPAPAPPRMPVPTSVDQARETIEQIRQEVQRRLREAAAPQVQIPQPPRPPQRAPQPAQRAPQPTRPQPMAAQPAQRTAAPRKEPHKRESVGPRGPIGKQQRAGQGPGAPSPKQVQAPAQAAMQGHAEQRKRAKAAPAKPHPVFAGDLRRVRYGFILSEILGPPKGLS